MPRIVIWPMSHLIILFESINDSFVFLSTIELVELVEFIGLDSSYGLRFLS
jgi:hypothetical protein